ncbi:MAG: hypothetical protein COV36_00340 [Alphaproteobacteria bacterium CG11_big_fil_rev_8_21_14_0_20_44_7]|nr:MAG: hypothetical protein COV36_00340 [Alphaproteobacteria bacterium CG11_big_fil_rev_8_21_14_0_20_44_7]
MPDIIVKADRLKFNNKEYRCAYGKSGFAQNKFEGDNCTPIGKFPLREVLYRADRIETPKTKLPISEIQQNDGWCDDAEDINYNRKVTLPHPARHEQLFRDEHIYDIIIVVGYNDAPPVKAKGSAIFIHLARENYAGTEGCIALDKTDLLEILHDLDENSHIIVEDS